MIYPACKSDKHDTCPKSNTNRNSNYPSMRLDIKCECLCHKIAGE